MKLMTRLRLNEKTIAKNTFFIVKVEYNDVKNSKTNVQVRQQRPSSSQEIPSEISQEDEN